MRDPLDFQRARIYRGSREDVRMRGEVMGQESMLSLMTPERRIPPDHPIRRIKALADAELARLSSLFDALYAERGRPSIAPEALLKACLLIALYSVRSERQFCERLHYDLLFRWFLDLPTDGATFDASTFAKNKPRVLNTEVARRFFDGVVAAARSARLLSADHFSVDGTLIEAWGSLKSFRPKAEATGDRPPPDDPGNPTVNFHGERRQNATHASTTDPDARLLRKGAGKEAKLVYGATALMENRHGLCVDLRVDIATDVTESTAALGLLERQSARGLQPQTVGGDKAFDNQGFVTGCRVQGVTPHVAQNTSGRRSRIDARTTRHATYTVSQRCRKRIEELWGWGKTYGGIRKSRYRGVGRTGWWAYIMGTAYNLLRMAKLMPELAGT